MKILALQLKRIGDLVLTTPALGAIKAWCPDCHLALAVHSSTAGLLPVVPHFDSAIVFGPGRGWSPWQQVLTGHFDVVLDFTGSDRSAVVTRLTRAGRRLSFAWVRSKGPRSLAFNEWVESSVRERHTIDHYLDLAEGLTSSIGETVAHPALAFPVTSEANAPGKYAVLHPFTARPEKNWSPQSWGEVAAHCTTRGLRCLLTGGSSAGEGEHHTWIIEAWRRCTGGSDPDKLQSLAGQTELLQLCSLIAEADLVISCDTAAVHLAAAYRRPQIALFGPTNPFHWRPRHERAVTISAAQPQAPMTEFDPRMKGARMDRISTATVCRAIDALLAS